MLLFSNFSNEHYLISFYFHLNQLRNFSTKTYRSVKKHIPLAQRPRGQYAFFRTSRQPINVRHDMKTSSVIINIQLLFISGTHQDCIGLNIPCCDLPRVWLIHENQVNNDRIIWQVPIWEWRMWHVSSISFLHGCTI